MSVWVSVLCLYVCVSVPSVCLRPVVVDFGGGPVCASADVFFICLSISHVKGF